MSSLTSAVPDGSSRQRVRAFHALGQGWREDFTCRSSNQRIACDLEEVQSRLTRLDHNAAPVDQKSGYQRLVEQHLAQLSRFLAGLVQGLLARDVTQPSCHPLERSIVSAQDDPQSLIEMY